MLLHLAGTILLSLLTAELQRNRKIQTNGEAILGSPGRDVRIPCRLPAGLLTSQAVVTWYKEKQDRSLRMIHQGFSYSDPGGKYSGPSNNLGDCSLTISNVQKNDSGVYYCFIPTYASFNIHQKTRLIITNISRPTFSVLVPSVSMEDQLNHSLPLLCLIFDPNPAWETVSWDIDGETSRVQKDVDIIEENGVFSIWSLKMVPAKTWAQRTAGSCSVQQDRNTENILPEGRQDNQQIKYA
ncbi:immunoglobulin lambda-1 light chain-like isoform X2 [Eublepharis macularius]|uniref:immunoglobulin lambda-1 light chain-like isoform X2 n=1 Tax=Eublepharis macularius TaxID=481883 RepID=UPI00240FB6B9|nr:immunoglobulin lambda-1 light chain-like isoform X2 [Eublepharis macularius]